MNSCQSFEELRIVTNVKQLQGLLLYIWNWIKSQAWCFGSPVRQRIAGRWWSSPGPLQLWCSHWHGQDGRQMNLPWVKRCWRALRCSLCDSPPHWMGFRCREHLQCACWITFGRLWETRYNRTYGGPQPPSKHWPDCQKWENMEAWEPGQNPGGFGGR